MRFGVLLIAIAAACSSQSQTMPNPVEVQNPPVAPPHDPSPEPEGSLAAFPRANKEAQAHARELVDQGRIILKTKGKAGAPEAASLFSSATREDPRNTSAYWELGWAHQIGSDYDAAISAWKTLRELDPKFPDVDTFITLTAARRDEPKVAAEPLPEPPLVTEAGRKKTSPRKVEAKVVR